MGAKEDREAWTKHIVKQEMATSLRRSKYGAQKTDLHGHRFDSTKEANRYLELAMLQAAGEISALRLQPEFEITVLKSGTYNGEPPRVKVASYFADFEYIQAGQRVIEDVKSKATATPVYRLKKKLVEALYGITIREV